MYRYSNKKSGPGHCVKCNRLYQDLLEHINKRHRDERFTQTDVGPAGLLACQCGRVVLSQQGLNAHQLRYQCQSPPLVSPSWPATRPSTSVSSSPLSSAPSIIRRSRQTSTLTPLTQSTSVTPRSNTPIQQRRPVSVRRVIHQRSIHSTSPSSPLSAVPLLDHRSHPRWSSQPSSSGLSSLPSESNPLNRTPSSNGSITLHRQLNKLNVSTLRSPLALQGRAPVPKNAGFLDSYAGSSHRTQQSTPTSARPSHTDYDNISEEEEQVEDYEEPTIASRPSHANHENISEEEEQFEGYEESTTSSGLNAVDVVMEDTPNQDSRSDGDYMDVEDREESLENEVLALQEEPTDHFIDDEAEYEANQFILSPDSSQSSMPELDLEVGTVVLDHNSDNNGNSSSTNSSSTNSNTGDGTSSVGLDSDNEDPDNPDLDRQNVCDQPFMGQCETWSHLDDEYQAQLIEQLGNPEMDVDMCEMVISPQEYLQRFKDTVAFVQLISRAPLRKLKRARNARGPKFQTWLLLAASTHNLWVPPEVKQPFFNELDAFQTAQPGRLLEQASTGVAVISTSVFVHCLIQAGCDTMRLKAYGQKMPISFQETEPAQVDHRWAKHNEWDIGRTFHSPWIWLFASKIGRTRGIAHYPMMVPISQDHGSVNISLRRKNVPYTVKVYPKIVHVIKSFNSHLQSSKPRTLNGAKNQVNAAINMIHSLTTKNEAALGGFRIEVTVNAPSLEKAVAKVKKSGLLEPSYWLNHGDGPHAVRGLSAHLVPREAFLDSANWIYQCAIDLDVFCGNNNSTPSSLQLHVLTDILNSIGWNNGRGIATKSLDRWAWWNDHRDQSNPTVFQLLCLFCKNKDEDIQTVFRTSRTIAGVIPCKAYPMDRDHRYQINEQSPFRIRCGADGCWHKIQRTPILFYLAGLTQSGHLDWNELRDQLGI